MKNSCSTENFERYPLSLYILVVPPMILFKNYYLGQLKGNIIRYNSFVALVEMHESTQNRDARQRGFSFKTQKKKAK